jgi:vancomycin resistance protein YoaR
VVRGLLVSADRDILTGDIPGLVEKYGAVAADWESGAIAWVAQKNGLRCLILRGVTDLVGATGGEAYGNIQVFHENTRMVMKTLIEQLPDWLKDIRPEPARQRRSSTKWIASGCMWQTWKAVWPFTGTAWAIPLIWRTAAAAGLRMPGTEAEIVIQTEQAGQEVNLTVSSADAAAQRFARWPAAKWLCRRLISRSAAAAWCATRGATSLVLLDSSKGLLATDKDKNVTGNY